MIMAWLPKNKAAINGACAANSGHETVMCANEYLYFDFYQYVPSGVQPPKAYKPTVVEGQPYAIGGFIKFYIKYIQYLIIF